MKSKITKLMIATLMVMTAHFSQAAKVDGGPQAACEGLKVATGKPGKGYSKLFKNLTDATNNNPRLCEVITDGGLDNLTVASKKKADVVFAQYDQLKFMAQGDPNIAALQVVATLNSNFLHIVVNAAGVNQTGPKKMMILAGDTTNIRIRSLSDLKGRTVALVGSAKLLGRQLDKDMQLNMNFVEVEEDPAAFVMVQKGQVFAALTMAGWPSGPVDALTSAQGLTLAAFDGPTNNPLYTVKSYSYKKIGVYNQPALAIQNVLLARPFVGQKVNDVLKLKEAIAAALPDLKDGDFEPGWNEINTLDGKVDWVKIEGKMPSSINKMKK